MLNATVLNGPGLILTTGKFFKLTKTDFRCCIDKTSSAELSEAINSMFRWYQNAVVCYAFLSDVPNCVDISAVDSPFAKSRWFTRGWTLQELIAPSNLIFFSKDWEQLGTKAMIHAVLSTISGIEKDFLSSENLELASAAKKMSWAASRKTSRTEDMAYCLLGIFDLNMPLIYGEGKKAFRRLQEELLKSRPGDHTIFAWGTIVSSPSIKITNLGLYLDEEPVPLAQSTTYQPLLSLLAESPQDFASSGGFSPLPLSSVFYRGGTQLASFPVVVDGGVRLDLPVVDAFDSIYHWKSPEIEQIRTARVVALLCYHETNRNSFLKIPVQRWGTEYFGRTREMMIESDPTKYNVFRNRQTITVATERRPLLHTGDAISRRHLFPRSSLCEGSVSEFADTSNDDAIIEARKFRAYPWFGYFYGVQDLGGKHGFAIRFSRTAKVSEFGDALLVELIPASIGGDDDDPYFDNLEMRWWDPMEMQDAKSVHSHIMRIPFDKWELNAKPFPAISIKAERMPLDVSQSYVDVLDIVVWPVRDSNDRFRTLSIIDR
ncbi:hypothetical protein LTR78_004090 [Recurvomyces mirabilis]|uniref:DUF8212 domain-containing protein n=1 Tax=Recurvomyces mirabilis TaxID=574656 RepID=A0AAE1C2R4_9PEZI|nr:hypothetical protein LTR78_004090 [Recurvomyces mirabilis]KAK5153737.1 hypothetical protein LTS14_007431 [Recurvomyces mirabilis]